MGNAGRTTIFDAIAIHPAGHHVAQQEIALKLRGPQRLIAVVEASNGRGSMVVPQHLRCVAQPVVRFAEDGIKPAMDDLINGHRMAVRGEEVAQGIKTEPEDVGLPVAHLLDAGTVATEPESGSTHFQEVAIGALHPRLIAHTLTAIKPSVEAPSKIVGEVVGVGRTKGTVEHVTAVRPSIAIGILKADDIGNTEHHGPVPEWSHGIRHAETVGEHLIPVGPTVGPKIRQDADDVVGRLVRRCLDRIATGLGNPQTPGNIEAHAHRLADLGFRSHQLHFETFGHREGPQGLGGASPRR